MKIPRPVESLDNDGNPDAEQRWRRLGLVCAKVAGVSWLVHVIVGYTYWAGEFAIVMHATLIVGILLFPSLWGWLACVARFREMRWKLAFLATAWVVVSFPFTLFGSVLVLNGVPAVALRTCIQGWGDDYLKEFFIILPWCLFVFSQGMAAIFFAVYAWKLPRCAEARNAADGESSPVNGCVKKQGIESGKEEQPDRQMLNKLLGNEEG